MNRTTLLSLILGGTLVPHCLSQELVQTAAQPASVQPAQVQAPGQVAQRDQGFELEVTAPAPRKESSKNSNKRSPSIVTRARGVPEVRTFSFTHDGPRPSRPLMIRSSRADTKAMNQLSEDLAVM